MACGEEEDIKRSYDSLYFTENVQLSDKQKRFCLETLHCSVNKTIAPDVYTTWTSEFVRTKDNATQAYTLFKVKRWLLDDENYIFDPFKQMQETIELAPSNTLWSTFDNPQESRYESQLSLDGIIATAASSITTWPGKKSLDVLRKLETILQVLNRQVKTSIDVQYFKRSFSSLNKLDTCGFFLDAPCARPPLKNLLQKTVTALHDDVKDIAIPEKVFETVFSCLVQCVAASIGEEKAEHVFCCNHIDCHKVDKVVFKVKLNEEVGKTLRLEVTSEPDLFMYALDVMNLPIVLAVVEAKGMRKGKIIQSDDEENIHVHTPETRSSSKGSKPYLPPLNEDDDDEDDEDDDYDEIEFDKVIQNPPAWLKSIRTLPSPTQNAIRLFLPQLIGEMLCVSRCQRFVPLKMKDGLLFGVGVIGFNIYFVSVMDSCRDSPESVINAEAHTHVFITRPLNLFVQKDRRIILKTICAAMLLSPV